MNQLYIMEALIERLNFGRAAATALPVLPNIDSRDFSDGPEWVDG